MFRVTLTAANCRHLAIPPKLYAWVFRRAFSLSTEPVVTLLNRKVFKLLVFY